VNSRGGAWVLLPVLGAPVVHAPVLRYDVARGLKRPLDGGATLRGRRLLGDNKTWRGALVMTAGVLAATAALHRSAWYRDGLPDELRAAGPLRHGCALAAGTVGGELPNSLLKRQLGIAPGTQRASVAGAALVVFDQADFVIGIWAALLPVWRMPARDLAATFAIVVAVHSVINVVGYAIGARDSLV
jgi:CDP-2,3-bis-(O-geranylgeranyl)-sn-glycerol synthase